jgi:hypothetical protein
VDTSTRLLRAGDVQLYRVCEDLSEPLIYLMVLFSPWAFGTTQPWAIWIMNIAGYFLGVLLLGKLAVRHWKGYRPPRWESKTGDSRSKIEDSDLPSSIFHLRSPTQTLAILTVLILGYCFVSAVNARSTYHRSDLSFEYHQNVAWLPHSFDSGRTWFSFWGYLALACSFWSVRDWLLGKSDGETRAERQQGAGSGEQRASRMGQHRTSNVGGATSAGGPQATETEGSESGGQKPVGRCRTSEAESKQPTTNNQQPTTKDALIPTRLRRLLWVLAINGGLLGLEGIVQRLEGSGRLLFLVKPRVNPAGETQFGPWAYRANASAYFNLLWPVCLGFWWTLHRNAGVNLLCLSSRVGGEGANPREQSRDGNRMRSTARHHLLLACAAIMAACPIISTSRGGALITVGQVLAAGAFMISAHLLFAPRGRVRARVRGQRSEVRGQTAEAESKQPTSNIEHSTSNVEDIQYPTSKSEEKTRDARRQRWGSRSQTSEGRGRRTKSSIFHLPSSISKVLSSTAGQSLVLLGVCFAAALILGYALGWKALKPRMAQISEGFEGREQMYDAARPMASDYPLFGTGPGTFESVFQLYRISTDTYWPAQLHNDWLETRITFGWVGSGLIGLAMVIVVLRWFGSGGIHGGRRFTFLIWLALAGCLVHARYDFPFQIYSIVLLFLVLCAVLFDLSRRA